jgi:divalent metal cation (Fe/Co/Zn/Cd) transporter
MKWIIGLGMAAIGFPVAWWAFNKAVAGHDLYNWVWVIALFIGAIGIIILVARFKRWIDY